MTRAPQRRSTITGTSPSASRTRAAAPWASARLGIGPGLDPVQGGVAEGREQRHQPLDLVADPPLEALGTGRLAKGAELHPEAARRVAAQAGTGAGAIDAEAGAAVAAGVFGRLGRQRRDRDGDGVAGTARARAPARPPRRSAAGALRVGVALGQPGRLGIAAPPGAGADLVEGEPLQLDRRDAAQQVEAERRRVAEVDDAAGDGTGRGR